MPNADSAGPIVSLTFFILVALSGLWFPITPNSGLATFANFFPIRHLINALVASFTGNRAPRCGPGTTSASWPIWGVVRRVRRPPALGLVAAEAGVSGPGATVAEVD